MRASYKYQSTLHDYKESALAQAAAYRKENRSSPPIEVYLGDVLIAEIPVFWLKCSLDDGGKIRSVVLISKGEAEEYDIDMDFFRHYRDGYMAKSIVKKLRNEWALTKDELDFASNKLNA